MSKFSNPLPGLLVLLALTACSSLPEPAPRPLAAGTTETQPSAAPAVDFNQRAYTEAVASLKNGHAEDALDLLQQVSRDAPDKPFVFTNLGLAHFRLEQFDSAESAFRQAVEHNSRDAVAHNHLGILQRRKGAFDDARKRYQRAIEIDRDYARAHLNLGILFDIYLQDLEKALRQYERYQALTSEEDGQVSQWIVDIKRRIKPASSNSQG